MIIARCMLLASGEDPQMLDRLDLVLGEAGIRMCTTHAFSFDETRELRPDVLLHVDALPRVGAPAHAERPSLSAFMSAATAPGVARVIVVTTRAISTSASCGAPGLAT
jgi:hypothetical protein